MTRKLLVRWGVGVAAVALLAACSNSSSGSTSGSSSAPATSTGSSTSSSTGGSADVLGTPNAATGTPITVGMLNLEQGPVTFPEMREGVQAAIAYINAYKGGLGGHPLKLVTCVTDGQPATSARCANQILDKHPAFIIGGADTGAPGSMPVWQRANLAYVGGGSFTPAELNYTNGVIFSAIAGADNAAGVVYAKSQGVNSGIVVYTSDTEGTRSGLAVQGNMKKVGMNPVSGVPVPPTAADVSTQAATVVKAKRDMVYVTTPVGCASMLKTLKQLGSKAKVFVVDPCTDPRVIAAAGGGADGMIWGAPVDLPNSTPDATLYMAALQKFAPKDVVIDSITAIGFQSVMNIQAALNSIADNLTTASILSAFRTGSNHPNFMGHPYTCDGKQLPGSTTVCNAWQHIIQWSGGKASYLGGYVNPVSAMGS
ncbi:MAG TPA: ABC transporter substrate-binding protein [Actinomycetes bacterium]|nr:ABC transporter substrate-binding protein [Actinomycetes bacterium]